MSYRATYQSGTAFLIALSFFFFVSLTQAQAYTTTNQESFTVDGRTGIFLIEYKFGHQDHNIHMPLVSLLSEYAHPQALSYAIYDEEGNPAKGTGAGIILSNAPIEQGEYVTQKGLLMTFTLLVIFTPSEDSSKHNYHLSVTHLPFSFDGTTLLQLNPSELQYYETDPLSLEAI